MVGVNLGSNRYDGNWGRNLGFDSLEDWDLIAFLSTIHLKFLNHFHFEQVRPEAVEETHLGLL